MIPVQNVKKLLSVASYHTTKYDYLIVQFFSIIIFTLKLEYLFNRNYNKYSFSRGESINNLKFQILLLSNYDIDIE